MRLLIAMPSWHRRPWKGGKALVSSLTVAYLAGLCPRHYRITLVDESVDVVDPEAEADAVFLTFMTAAAQRAYALADRFRERGIPVVMGGVHPSVMPDEAAMHADAVVTGEAEPIWKDLLADLEAGRLKPRYQASELPSLEGLPHPRRDLLRREAYLLPDSVQTTRGCPLACRFCSVTRFFGQAYRYRPPEEVVEEIRATGNRNILFVDDNIVGNVPHAMRLFEALIPLKIRWVSQAVIGNLKSPELLRLARLSGCAGLLSGFESIDEETLREMNKRANKPTRYSELIASLHRHGIELCGSFVFGFDSQRPGIFEDTYRFCVKHQLGAAMFHILTPFPGTQLFEQLEKEGRLLHQDWGQYNLHEVVFRPSWTTAEELLAARDRCLRSFYSLPVIFRRLLRRHGAGILLRWAGNLGYRSQVRGGQIIGRVWG